MRIRDSIIKHHKTALVLVSALLILFIGLDLFIRQKSAFILDQIVKEVTKGKYSLKSGRVKFTYFPESILATQIHIRPVADSIPSQLYQLDADTIVVKLRSIWPLLFRRSLNIDELALVNPKLVILARTENKKPEPASFNLHDNLLLIQEQLNRTISVLRMDRFRIDNLSLKIQVDKEKYFLLDRVFLHIEDLFADVGHNRNMGSLELAGAIHLWMDRPNIVYPDSNFSISLDQFDWTSRQRYLRIENIGLTWKQEKASTDSFHIALHAVTFSRLDWSDWVNSGQMHYDSVAASTGQFYLQKLNPGTKSDSLKFQKGIFALISPLSIRHFEIREIQSSLVLRTKSSPAISTLKGDSLKINDLHIDISKKQPIQLGTVDMAIREFYSKAQDEKWQSSFASFRIYQNHVLIRDYQLQSRDNRNSEVRNLVRIPALEMSGISIPDMMTGKLIVREMGLQNPYIQVRSAPKTNRPRKTYRPFRESLPFVDVQSLRIRNGVYVNRDGQTGAVRVRAKGINGHLLANKFLIAKSVEDMPAAFDQLSVDSLELNFSRFGMAMERVQLKPRTRLVTIYRTRIHLPAKKNIIEFRKTELLFDSVQTLVRDKKHLYIKSVQIDSGNLNLDLVKKTRELLSPEKEKEEAIRIHIATLSLNHTPMEIRNKDQQILGYLNKLNLNDISNAGETWQWGKGEADLFSGTVAAGQWDLKSKSIHLDNEGSSYVHDAEFRFRKSGQNIDSRFGALVFRWSLHQPVLDEIHIPFLGLNEADIAYSEDKSNQDPDSATTRSGKKLSIRIDSFRMERPRIHADSRRNHSSIQLQTRIQEITMSNAALSRNPGQKMALNIGHFYLDAGQSSFQKDSSLQLSFSGIRAMASSLYKPSGEGPFQFELTRLKLDSLQLDMVKKGRRKKLDSRQIMLTGKTFLYADKDSLLNSLYHMPSLSALGTNLILDNPKQMVRVNNINANIPEQSLSLDSFAIIHKLSRDSFFRSWPFEKDYITISTGPVQATGLRISQAGKDTGFAMNTLNVDNLFLKAERDKRMPDDTVWYKPLLARMIQRIPLHVALDTLNLERSTIWHNVIAEKSGEEGTIFFTDLNGWVSNIRNFGVQEDDTLRIRVNARLMDKGNLYMRFRQPYLDTLQGFLLTARMGKFPMPELDRILVPLTRIRISKGQIDTLWLQARGNDLLAFGEMEIDYHKLKVEKLDKQEKKQGFISWLANIIVRTANRKQGTLYVERQQNKSIFNYWGRIALSGLLTNIRVASSRKYRKKYEAALQKYQLPPHLLDEDY